ncbi:MAG: DUF3306 domain-containing protein [Pseudomonadota bacterium]
MTKEDEAFLARWSRLKREARAEAPKQPPAQPAAAEASSPQSGTAAALVPAAEAPPLPPVETLTPESDFRPFMAGNVPPEMRQAALKKLFSDAHFNVPDPFEAYSEDYTRAEPIPRAMLKMLEHAKRLLAEEGEQPGAAQPPQAQPDAARAPAQPNNGAPGKDA